MFSLDDRASAYWGAYGVAKAGQTAFMKILADELESSAVTVCGLLPGSVKTAFRTYAFPAEDTSALTEVNQVAKAAAYLLADTGKTLGGKATHGRLLTLDEISPLINC